MKISVNIMTLIVIIIAITTQNVQAQEDPFDETMHFDNMIQREVDVSPHDGVVQMPNLHHEAEFAIEQDYNNAMCENDDHRYDAYANDDNDGSTSFGEYEGNLNDDEDFDNDGSRSD